MNIHDDEDIWTCMLLVHDHKESFLVVNNPHKDCFLRERWALPFFDNESPNSTPTHTANWLAKAFLEIELPEHELRLVCTTRDDMGFLVYLFENTLVTPEIKKMFDFDAFGDWYQTMTFHRAGLIHSGLDSQHKIILSEGAGLIENYSNSGDRTFLKIVHSKKDLKSKVHGFAPKPL